MLVLSLSLELDCLNRYESLNYQMKVAKFPHHRDLQQFDFTQSKVEQSLIKDLAQADFMDRAHNLIFVGGTGTGKTHLATAIGIKALHS